MNVYEFDYPVRLDDLDYMGIVSSSNWLIFLERARIDLLDQIGSSFIELSKNKIGGVVAEANIKYLRPAYFGDRLKIKITPHSPFKKGLILTHSVENQRQETCLEAVIKMIFVDATGKPTKMPEKIAQVIFGSSIELV